MQQPREKRRVKSEKKRYFLTKMIKISPEGTPILFTFLFSLFTQEVLQIFCNTSLFYVLFPISGRTGIAPCSSVSRKVKEYSMYSGLLCWVI